jgi:hypothetical protein
MKPVRKGGDLTRDLADAGERAAQLLGQARVIPRRRRDGEQVERAVGAGDGEMPAGEIDVGFGCLKPVRCDAPAPLDDFARGAVRGYAGKAERASGMRAGADRTRSVSPVTSRTQSGCTASHSQSSCAELVSWPWPLDSILVRSAGAGLPGGKGSPVPARGGCGGVEEAAVISSGLSHHPCGLTARGKALCECDIH